MLHLKIKMLIQEEKGAVGVPWFMLYTSCIYASQGGGWSPLRRERRRRLCDHLAPHSSMCEESGTSDHEKMASAATAMRMLREAW